MQDSVEIKESNDTSNNECVEVGADVEGNYKDGGWGWVVVGAAFTVGLVRFGTERSYPVFYLSIMQEYGINFAQVSQIISSFFSCMGASGVFAPALIKKLGCRKCMMLSGFIAAVSCFAASLPGPYWKLVLCYGIIPGICFGISMVVTFVSVNEHFEKRQSLAIQLFLLSTSAGAFVASPVCVAFIQSYTWRGALLIISAIYLHILPAGATMRPVQAPQRKSESKLDKTSDQKCSGIFRTVARYFDLHVFSMAKFYLSMIYISAYSIGLYSSFSFVVSYSVKELGTSNHNGAMLVVAQSVGEVTSKLLCGFFFQKIPQQKQKLFVCCLFILAAFFFGILPLVKSYNFVICICVAFGLTTGCFDGLYSVFFCQDFNRELYPTLIGFTNMTSFLTCSAASLLIGHIVDVTGDLSNAFYFGSASYVLAFITMFILHKLTIHSSHNPEERKVNL